MLPQEDAHVPSCASAFGDAMFTLIVEKGNWVNAYSHLCSSAQHLASSLTDEGIRLFDNTDFLEWISEASNPYAHPVLPSITNNASLPANIKELFLSSSGACPFVNIDDIETALTTLYNYRADLHLETEINLHPFEVDASSCSAATREIIDEYVDFINDGRETKALWEALGPLYDFIEDYIECGDSVCH